MSTDDAKPQWDDDDAKRLVGKSIIVGTTIVDANDELIEQRQRFGTIVVADARQGIGIRLEPSEEMYWLPPALTAFHPAPPGAYQFHSTGEVVIDPDLISTWTIRKPDEA